MRQYRYHVLAMLTLAVAMVAGVLWTQTASAHLPQQVAGSGLRAQVPPNQPVVLTRPVDTSATDRPARIRAVSLQEATIDLSRLGIHPVAQPLPVGKGAPPSVPGLPQLLLPNGGTIGTSNAYVVASPDVVSQSTTSAFGILGSGFTPAETVSVYFNGALATTGPANVDGVLALGVNTSAGQGYLTIEYVGGTSGKRAGTVLQVLDAAPPVPGFAAAPHAINTSANAHFYAYGFRFLANSTVTLTRNGVSLGTAATNAAGRFFITITPGNNGDTAAIYAAVTSTVGSMSGYSLEERADAGTPPTGDQNPARVFIDRPVLNGGTGGRVALVGEGFQPGETVNMTDCAAVSLGAADANGAVATFLTVPAGSAIFHCVLTGATSGRVGQGSLQTAANATNAPSAINWPGTLTSGASSFTFMYDRLLPNQAGTIYVDGVSQGAAPPTNANGSNAVQLTAPATPGIHSVTFIGATGQVAIAPLYVLQGAVTPTPTATATQTSTATATATPVCGSGAAGPWVSAAPYPSTIVRYAFAQVGDSFYVLGGVSNGTRVATVSRYDVGPGTWTALANIPVASEAPAAAYWNGKIYLAEGDTGNSFQIYDIASNTWSAGPNVPGASNRYGAAAGAFNNKVYIIGGNAAAQNDVQIYDIASNSWSTGTPAANGMFLPGYQTVGQYLYVVGGFSGTPLAAPGSSVLSRSRATAPSANNPTTLRLDMSTGTWSNGPAFTPGRADGALAYSGGKLFVLGGDTTGGGYFDSTTAVDELDVSTWPAGSWVSSPPVLPNPARQANQAGFTSSDGRIWSVGGLNGATFQFLSDTYSRSQGVPCATATAIATNTPTNTTVPLTNTPSPTPTPICGPGGTPGPWAVRSPAPIDYYGGSATSDGTVAWVAGGYSFSSGQNLDQFSRYNPTTNTWTTLSPMPQAAAQASAVYAPNVNKVFVFGGQDGATGLTYAITRIYDVAGGTWTTGAAMPAVRAFMASGYYNGKIYLVGGYTDGQVTSSQAQVWEYDPVANTFDTTRAPMIQPLGGAASAVVNGHLYVIGGRDGVIVARDQVYDYNISANTWTSGAPMPVGSNVPGDAVIDGKIWVFGGGNPFRTLSNPARPSRKATDAPSTTSITQIYDPATNSWSTGPSLNQARSFPAGTNVGNYAVAVGGYTGTTTNSTEVSFTGSGAPCGTPTATPASTATATAPPTSTVTATLTPPQATATPVATATCVSGPTTWRTEPPLTVARAYAAGAVVNNQFYVISGFSGSAPDSAVERFDPATNTWATLAPIPTPISQARAAALGTRIYVAGGFNNGFGGQTTGMQIYDTATGLWSQGAPLPEARAGAGVAAANGKIYVIAGFGPGFATRYTVYEYDPVANSYATRAPAPAAEGNIAAGVLGGLIYAVGGSATYMHYAYDPVANTWATIAAGPTPNHQTPGVFALNGELWVVGGTNGFSPYPANQQVQIYTPGTDRWRFGPAFNIPR
jgi:N-acetylneuraminic acid mutarotase